MYYHDGNNLILVLYLKNMFIHFYHTLSDKSLRPHERKYKRILIKKRSTKKTKSNALYKYKGYTALGFVMSRKSTDWGWNLA